jgi:hypothetical protein
MLRLNDLEYTPNFQALSLFRLCFAVYLLVQWALVLPFYGDFYGADGLLPFWASTPIGGSPPPRCCRCCGRWKRSALRRRWWRFIRPA